MNIIPINIQRFGASASVSMYEYGTDITNNCSYVHVEVSVTTTGSTYNNSGDAYVTGSCSGQNAAFPFSKTYFNISKNQTKTIFYADFGPFYHNSDGTAGVVTASANVRVTSSYNNVQASNSIQLGTIPRTSGISGGNGYIEETTSVYIDSKSSGFTHNVSATFGGVSTTIASGVGGGYVNWTIPDSFYSQIPNSTSGTGTITCSTYSGGTLIGSSSTNFTAYTRESRCNPSITGVAVDTNQDTLDLTNDNKKVVKGYSNMSITPTYSTRKSASLSQIRLNGTPINSSGVVVMGASTNNFVLQVVDSRGYSASYTIPDITLVDYVPVSIAPVVVRKNQTSAEVHCSYSGNYYDGSFGYKPNTLSIIGKYKEKGSSTWIDLNVPSKNKNLFDKDTMVVDAFINAYTGEYGYSEAFKSVYIKCKPNTTYTFSQSATSNRYVVGYTTDNNVNWPKTLTDINYTDHTFTTNADTQYVIIMVSKTTEDTTSIADILASIQIEEGPEATSYQPYSDNEVVITGNSYSQAEFVLPGTFPYNDAFDFQFIVSDKLTTQTQNLSLTKGVPNFSIYKDHIEVNGVPVGSGMVGTILWQNESPSTPIPNRTRINLNSSDYDYYEVYYYVANTSLNDLKTTGLIPKGKGTSLDLNVYSSAGMGATERYFERISDTQFQISECWVFAANTGYTIKNDLIIPSKIIGYKSRIAPSGLQADIDLYSAEETKTNKVWIDGKPIYRKVIKSTSLVSANYNPSFSLGFDLSTISDFTLIETKAKQSGVNVWVTASSNNDASSRLSHYVNSNNKIVIRNSWDLDKIIITLEYTKTTD